MAATDTIGLIIAGAIGAGGAVAAQIISSVVTSLKDTKRFNWEREKQERDWKNHEREQFLALKQQLYAEHGAVIEALIEYAHDRVEYDRPPDDEVLTNIRHLGNLRSNISLIGSEGVCDALVESHGKIMKAIEDVQNDKLSAEQREESLTEAMRVWWRAHSAMREDLLEQHGADVERSHIDNRP